MNVPIRRVAVVALALFLILMGAATWIQFVQAPSLNADGRNSRSLYRELSIQRGPIVAGGQTIAESVPVDDAFKYQRVYSQPEMYAAVTGYYSFRFQSTGLERSANEYLAGTSDSLWWDRFRNLVSGGSPQGSSVEVTIDPVVQQAAWDALGDQRGAVVALDPKTGAILALVSKPSYDPNLVASHSAADASAAYQALADDSARPLDNRATAGRTYPPGSTFKLVTAAAALEDGAVTTEDQIPAPDQLQLPQSSRMLNNFGGESCSPTGTMTLADALRISCNTAFAQLGMDLGPEALDDQAEAFGFDSRMSVPLPVTPSHFPLEVDGQTIDDAQTALSAIGQYDVRVTPLQVAMVSAAIANGGTLMQPYLVDRVRTPDLSVAVKTDPEEIGTPISRSTADSLRDMMVGVVQDGTGTSAQIPGVQVAGKSGTAETTADAAPHAWFTSFAPADDPQVVVAVIVENGGDAGNEATGGRVAAPIARAVMEAVIDR